jgi:tetratricopeptide (TPR) repeat protein
MPIQKPIKLDKKALKKNELAIFVDQAVHYIRKNPKTIIIPIVAVVIGIVFIYATVNYFVGQQKTAELAYMEAINYYHNAGKSPDKASQTINYTQCIERFKNIIDKYSRTKSAQYAQLYLADSYYHLGRNDDAIKTYQNILNKTSRGFTAAWAQLSLGYIYLNQNDSPKAIAAFDQLVVRQPESFLVPEALVQLGKCYEQSGNLGKAIDSYTRVMKTYPTSGWAAEADGRLTALTQTKSNG